MKTIELDPKRRPMKRSGWKKVHARTLGRQRVAATAGGGGELTGNVPNVGVARALMIIFGLHVVAIAGIVVHNRYLDGAPPPAADAAATAPAAATAAPAAKPRPATATEPKILAGDTSYVVVAGDNYAKIAAQQGVDEQDLRIANGNVPVRAGRILRIPPRRIVAVEPAELARRRGAEPPPPAAIVAAETLAPAEPILVRTARHPVAGVAGPPESRSYIVQPGDTLWRISNHFQVDQQQVAELNGITDPTKIRVGMSLKIPAGR